MREWLGGGAARSTTMLSYETLEDVLTAVLVVAVVAVVVAAAWLSTSVREQPLVATAVVVFHSGGTVEGESGGGGGGGGGGSASETPGSGNEAAATSTENKDSEAMASAGEAGAQVTDMPQDEAAPPRTQECAAGGQNTSAVGAGGDAVDGGGAVRRGSDGECVSPTPEETVMEGTSTTLPPVQSRPHEEGPEMELRRRRLQHFVSMGGASASTIEDTPSTAVDEAEPDSCSSSREGPAVVEERLASTTQTEALQTEALATSDRQQEEAGGQEEESKKEEEAEDREQGREEMRPPGSIKIRLKFLDETQRYVFAQLTEKVGTFKRQHFSIEQDANRRIRLIFNGQLLSRDSSTLAQYGLFDNCVVHCHVSQPQLLPHAPGRSGEASAQEEEDAYVSRLLAPLLYGVMVVMWYLRYEYGHLFNTMSTIILLFLTALLLISTYLLYITQHVPQAATAAAATPVQITGRTLAHASSSSSPASSSTSSSSPMSASASTAT